MLEVRGWLHFAWPQAFWFLLVTPWVWWLQVTGKSGFSRTRALVALQLRLWLIGLFIAVLAEPRAVRKSDALSLVYALDISDSMGPQVSDQSLNWILQTAARKPPKDEAGLVVFGQQAAVELPPRATFPFEAINSIVPKDGTDLAKGLRTAGAVLPGANAGRIVLISDGNQTEGEVLPVLDELKARGVPVDVLPVNFDFQKEVWLERLDLPGVVKQGEPYEATVLLSALSPGKGMLRLWQEDHVVEERAITYAAGKNRYTFAIPGQGSGYFQYRATVDVPAGEDSFPENNVALGYVYVKGEGRILVVTDAHADTREWEPLVAALRQGERTVQVRMSYEMPRDALSLLPYDLIIVPNTAADGFDAVQMQAIHDAIFNLGVGFLMLGSEHTFGPGGYHHTAIEKALPVTMDVTNKRVLPSGALVIALDCSGSMAAPSGGTTKIGLADRGAVLAINALSPQDYFSMLAVDTQAHAIVPLGRYASKDENAAKMMGVTAGGGGIYIYTAMIAAAQALEKVDAAVKHVILFSDAADAEEQAAGTEPDGTPGSTTALEFARAMKAVKVTLTVVGLGTEHDKDVAFLQQLAEAGGGRFFLTNDAETLPQIFVKEALTLRRPMLQTRTFAPEQVFPSAVLKGIESMPSLHGYVLTSPKPRAGIVLQVPPVAEAVAAGDPPDPLLAIWHYGLGTTAAWTSDFAANWARDWMPWEKYRPFLQQLVTEISRVETKSNLALTTTSAGAQGLVVVDDQPAGNRFLDLRAHVTGPHRESRDIPLEQIAPRRYRAAFPLWGKGYYQVSVTTAGEAEGSPGEHAMGGFAVPYSAEYLRFKSDPILLRQIAERTGGHILAAADTDLFHGERHPHEASTPVFQWFLFALAFLLPLDVAVRRVQIDWSVIGAWFRRRREDESSVTMQALLGRKTQAKAAIPPPLPTKASSPTPTRPVIAGATAPSPHPLSPPPPMKDVVPSPAPVTTTERLLHLKRRRSGQNDRPA